MKMKQSILIMYMLFFVGIFVCGCSTPKDNSEPSGEVKEGSGISTSETETEGNRNNEAKVLVPSQDGEISYEEAGVSLDASNTDEGYISVKYSGNATKVRMIITCPNDVAYNYLLPVNGEYYVYPLTEGDGNYNVAVYENIVDDQYAGLFSKDISVNISDENKVYLYPNAYVDFDKDKKAVKKGVELAGGASDDLDVVEAVYHYVTQNVSYDYDKAETVQSGYVPDVDDTLDSGKGICFDYAALMATMLRTQGIPTKLEVGYAGEIYHAWISVYVESEGWIDDIITFDGNEWVLMDPTLASYASKDTIKDYMDNTTKYYQLKYKY